MRKAICILLSLTMLSACGSVGRLKAVGKTPPLTEVAAVPSTVAERSLGESGGFQRRVAATPAPAVPSASLFRAGAGAFLADQRASSIGDILTIRIDIDDRAEVGNTTSRTRSGSENAGIAGLLGLQKYLPDTLADLSSESETRGDGSISRSETINMTMSAIVTDVLPNGNLIVRGRQEVRVNYEVRELVVTGIVRPQDIGRDNSIPHSQIAEARISYGGRGHISDVQQARWGQQIYEALFPF